MRLSLRSMMCMSLVMSMGIPGILRPDSIPVAPIQTVSTSERENVYRIQTEKTSFIISPEDGALMEIQTASRNLLTSPLRISPLASPVDKPWEHRAWKTSENTSVIMLSRSLEAPLSLRIVHLIEIPGDGTQLTQITRVTATAPSDPALLNPTATWTTPLPNNMWVHQDKASNAACTVWTDDIDSGLSTALHRILEFSDVYTFWQCSWSLEDSETSPENSFHADPGDENMMVRGESGPLNVPPQGWTLQCKVTLDLAWPTPGESPCEVLATWSPSTNPAPPL